MRAAKNMATTQAPLKHAAFELWQTGHRIVPLKGKTPLVAWQRWQSEPQSPQDFESLPWGQADGFGIICGVQLNNGYYVGALDCDLEKGGKPLSEDVLKKQTEVLENMRITQLEETPSGGKHLIYYSHSPVETKQDDRCGIEVLGSGKLCIMAPSEGYRRLNDNMPSETPNFNLEFQNALDKAGLKATVSKVSVPVTSEDKPFRRCGDCARWKVPYSGCTYAKDIREGTILADDVACDDFYPGRHSKSKERPPEHKASGLSEEGPFEAIYHNDQPMFLVKTKDGFITVESLSNQGHKVVPKELSECPYTPYGYDEGAIPNRDDLFWQVRNEFDTFLDIESIYKDFLAAFVLLSYQQEKVKTVPYVYFFGDNESGKTVALSLLSLLCYRPLFGVTVPPADLYGYLDDSDSPGTILEDEIQGLHKDMDKSKIYKAGYKQGATVPRTFILQHKRFIKYFRCFCQKGCAAEEMPRVKGLLERFIFIQMVEGFPKKDWADVNGEDIKRIMKLRNLLLKWRLATRLEWVLPEVELPVKGRLKELWKPVIQIVSGLAVEHDLRQFLERLQQERMNEKTNTLEGHLVKVIAEQYQRGRPIPFTDIWDALVIDLEAKLDDKKPNKMDSPEFGEVTKQRVGYRLREILSGKKKTLRGPEGRGNVKAYEFEEEKLKRIVRKYGYDLHTKLPSLPISEGVTVSETMEKDHEISMPKPVDTPQELGKLGVQYGNSVCNVEKAGSSDPAAPTMKNKNKVKSATGVENSQVFDDRTLPHCGPEYKVTLDDVKKLYWADEFHGEHDCAICGYRKVTSWKAELLKGPAVSICDDCRAEWEKKREVMS